MVTAKTANATEVDKVKQAVTVAVDAWVNQHLRNSYFSQDTPAWNHFQEGLPALIGKVVEEVKGL